MGQTTVGEGKGVMIGTVGDGGRLLLSIWLSRNAPTNMPRLRMAIINPPTSCLSPDDSSLLLLLAFACWLT